MTIGQYLLKIARTLEKLHTLWGAHHEAVVTAVRYLRQYGYLPESHTNTEQVVAALKRFQRFVGVLKGDGILGPRTLAVMSAPRCGCPDMANGKALAFRTERPNPWAKRGIKVVKWGFREYLTGGLSKAEQFDAWGVITAELEACCGIKTEYVANTKSSTAHVLIGVATRSNRSPRIQSDGNSGMLAATYLADARLPIPLDMDEAENWRIGVAPGHIDYERVARHEACHVFGDLEHSARDATIALMDPIYSESVGDLQPEDKARLVQKWGEPAVVVAPVEPPTDEGETVIRVRGGVVSVDGYTLIKRR